MVVSKPGKEGPVKLKSVDSARESMAVTIILPVLDETTSLEETVEVLLGENRSSLREILLIVCHRTTPQALAICRALTRHHPDLLQTRFQQRPHLGGAIRDAFEWAAGTHVLLMASDLETDPATVKELIAKAAEGYDIVTATRWVRGGAFHGYEPVKYVLNWLFQQSFRVLYGTKLSDLTYGFRIFKAEWVKKIAWEELRHPFLLETILKPLRLGARVAEIPTTWHTRREGVSHNSFFQTFLYFRPAIKTRFKRREELLAAPEDLLLETSA